MSRPHYTDLRAAYAAGYACAERGLRSEPPPECRGELASHWRDGWQDQRAGAPVPTWEAA